MPASENVNLRVLEHVADMDVPGYVRRWDDDRKNIAWRACIGTKEFLLYPSLRPSRLDELWLIDLGEFGSIRCRLGRLL